MSLSPQEWLKQIQRRLDDVDTLLRTLEDLITRKEKRKMKVIDKDLYRLEISVDKIKDSLLVKIYCTPKINVDPKYLFLIYLTEFFPEISSDLLDPEKSSVYTGRIVLTFRISPEFFEIDIPRILAKIQKFFSSITDSKKRAELDKIIPELFTLMKSNDPDSKRRLSLLKMKVNDILLYD